MSDLSSGTSRTLSAAASGLLGVLHEYLRRFTAAADGYDGSTSRAAILETAMAGYSELVTDERNIAPFAELERDRAAETAELVTALRARSARCAAVSEKYRALRLLEGRTGTGGYFDNVESCIEEEFGAVSPAGTSRVLLVGSGSFPMTLLNVAARTGAVAAGVDIDAEAVDLGRRVVRLLGGSYDITLDSRPVGELPFTRTATHIVFSSTVAAKYDLLHRLHAGTRDDVVVAMRFGDGLKSLFNYPMQDVDPARWRLLETVRRPDQVFDVAVYVKHDAGSEAGDA
ncbi:SAM-dependent methyltransferase [Myceligenerans crystallogenes]|uniref:D-histidine (S)-2-aminobutanoyltransferase CntL n=1 Tax=Myceligenerans crystallogenes TaxID=316335 RepID=A0ABN2N516_9MICO